MSNTAHRATRLGIGAAAFLGLLIVAWAIRLPVATQVLRAGLSLRGLDSQLTVTRLDAGGLGLEDVRLGPADDPSLLAETVTISYRLQELFLGRLRSITADTVELRAEFTGERFYLTGLPEPWRRSRGEDRPPPALSLTNVRVYFDTPAGQAVADLELVGDPEQGWRANADVFPAQIAQDDQAMTINTGFVRADIRPEAAFIRAELSLSDVVAETWSAGRLAFSVDLSGVAPDPARVLNATLSGAMTLSVENVSLDEGQTDVWSAQVLPLAPGVLTELLGPHAEAARLALRKALADISVSAQFDASLADGALALAWDDAIGVIAASGASLTIPSQSPGLLYEFGPRKVSAGRFGVDLYGGDLPELAVNLEALDITLHHNSIPHIAMRGYGRLGADAARSQFWDVDHLSVFADFNPLRFELNDEGWRLDVAGYAGSSTDMARLSGVIEGLLPFELPAVTDLDQAADIEVTMGADFALVFDGREGALTVSAAEDPAADPEQKLVVASRTTPSADEEGSEAPPTVTVTELAIRQLGRGNPLMRLTSSSLQMRLLTVEPSFTILSDAVGATTAEVRAATAEIDLTMRQGAAPRLESRIQGPRIDYRGARTGRVDARILELTSSFGERTTVSGLFEAVRLADGAAPFLVEDAAGELQLGWEDGRIADGGVTLARARIREQGERVNFAPMRMTANGAIANGMFTGRGQVDYTAATSARLADISFTMDVNARTGAIEFTTPMLELTPGDQPGQLSLRSIAPPLHDLFSAAQGNVQLTGAVRHVLNAEGARQWVTPLTVITDGLSFNAPFGRIDGVTGQVVFDDVRQLRATSPQSLAVAAFDPGVRFEDGQVNFSLPGDGAIDIASARFTLADGVAELDAMQTAWDAGLHEGVVRVRGVSLSELADQFEADGVRLEGRVGGTAPFTLDQGSVRINSGEFTAETPGRFRLRREGLAEEVFGDAALADVIRSYRFMRLNASLDGDLTGQMVTDFSAASDDAADIAGVFAFDVLRARR